MRVQNQVGRTVSLFEAVAAKQTESRSGGASSFEAFLEKTGGAVAPDTGAVEAVPSREEEEPAAEEEEVPDESAVWHLGSPMPIRREARPGEAPEEEGVEGTEGAEEGGTAVMTPVGLPAVMMMTVFGQPLTPVADGSAEEGLELTLPVASAAGRGAGAWAAYGAAPRTPVERMTPAEGRVSTLPIVEEALAEPRPGVLPGFPAAVLFGVAAGLDTVSEQASSPDTGLEDMLPPLEGEEQLTAQPSTPDLFEGLDPVRQGANTTPFVEQLRGDLVRREGRSERSRERSIDPDRNVRESDSQAQDLQAGSTVDFAHLEPVTSGQGAQPGPFQRREEQGGREGFRERLSAEVDLEELVAPETPESDVSGAPSIEGMSTVAQEGGEHVTAAPEGRREVVFEEAMQRAFGLEHRAQTDIRTHQAVSAEVRAPEAGDWAGRVRIAIESALEGPREAGGRAVVDMRDPDLGRIRIEVTLEAGRLKVDVWAEQDNARQFLRDSKHVLQEELARQQYQLEQFNVGSGPGRDGGDGYYRPGSERSEAGVRAVGAARSTPAPAVRVSYHEGELDTVA